MDMGFTREHAMEALLNTSTMEQATEYLLTHPPPIMGGVVRVSWLGGSNFVGIGLAADLFFLLLAFLLKTTFHFQNSACQYFYFVITLGSRM